MPNPYQNCSTWTGYPNYPPPGITNASSMSTSIAYTPSSSTYISPHTYQVKYSLADLEEAFFEGGGGPNFLSLGKNRQYKLPDGSKINIDELGNYKIEDKDAKVTYEACKIREFSPHINASDLLANFVGDVGKLGLGKKEVMSLPIELFIKWLILEAAKRDGDEVPPDVVAIEQNNVIKLTLRPKCLSCGRFIKRINHQNRFPFCSPIHGERYINKKQLQLN